MAIARRPRRKRLLFDPESFPRLSSTNHHCTSDPIEEQNCIAFAAGDKIHFWWPVAGWPGPLPPPYFWPKSAPLEETVEAFKAAYRVALFEDCDQGENGTLEEGLEKIAIFAKLVSDRRGKKHLEPTHAAIQSPLRNGKWRSKMGEDEDIEHELGDVGEGVYGVVTCFMKRTFANKRKANAILRSRIPSH